MLKVENLSYSYPQKDLYHHISFTIEPGEHCAFIGVSGSGKSTLIDCILNPEEVMFEGKLDLMPNCRIGYVSQFADATESSDTTVFDYIAKPFIAIQEELETICTAMESGEDLEALLEKYQETLDTFDAMGGDAYESNIVKKLNLAQLAKHADLKLSEISGGEFKLVQVIKEMLCVPDLLIMDEPDVFLDFANLNALKDLINAHKGTLLVITHNRYLLTHCFNKILHLENKELQAFEGRYIDYNFSLLDTKVELQELSAADTEEIERNNRLIEKLRDEATYTADPSKGKSLKARIKIQERLEARRIKAPFLAIKEPAIHFEATDVAFDEVALTVSNYSAAFDEVLLQDVNFEIGATEKVALIGANGTGKTTLFRDLYKNTHPAIQYGEHTQVAYLSQLQSETLDETLSVKEAFLELGFKNEEAILSYLLPYGFEETIIHQRIQSLSGGEKNMLQLAKIGATPSNLLLLDEPTSHLDTYSQIALEKAISAYTGAVLMISHDFYTIANCMDYALIIDEKTIRKISMRKFRKMIYAGHFNKDYLEIEQKKKAVETKIELALKDNNFTLAKTLCEELEGLIKQL